VAIRLAEWTGDIALAFSGLAGLLHWDWWFPVLFGTIAALTREASQGFLLTQQCGSGYLIRSITMTCLLCGVVATAAYMLSVIHDWSDEHCRTILKPMRDKLPTDGRVLVCEMVVTDEPGPTPAKMLDIEMLVMTVGGKERTKDEFAELFALSGLRLSRVVPTERPTCVIEALPDQV
jgi:O-methyltransferase domain